MEEPAIVYVVVEVDVYSCGGVGEQEPSGFRECESVGLGIYENGACAERCVGEYLHGIDG